MKEITEKPKEILSSSGKFLFGMHRGKEIGCVPTEYLRWVMGNINLIDEDYLVIVAELRQRR